MIPDRASHIYEVRLRQDRRGFDLISDALPFGRLWNLDAAAAVGYAKVYGRSHAATIRVFDESGAVIETPESSGRFSRAVIIWPRL
jgi:hypothetical protein